MANFDCARCGRAIHLGRCDQVASPAVRPAFKIDGLPNGEYVIRLNGVSVAAGFDSRGEAQEWIDEQ